MTSAPMHAAPVRRYTTARVEQGDLGQFATWIGFQQLRQRVVGRHTLPQTRQTVGTVISTGERLRCDDADARLPHGTAVPTAK